MMGGVTALPADDFDPDDPVEILRVLPSRFHGQFLAEYEAAVAGARRPEEYRRLHRLLRLWRLSAIALSDPGYEARRQAVEEAVARAGRVSRWRRLSRTGRSGSRRPGGGALAGEVPA